MHTHRMAATASRPWGGPLAWWLEAGEAPDTEARGGLAMIAAACRMEAVEVGYDGRVISKCRQLMHMGNGIQRPGR